jgi:DNA mismatch endonuclease (patch repair protein)
MVDRVSKKIRSLIMARVRSKNTQPEIVVRALLHRLGFRFGLHTAKLPGKPDLFLPKYRTIIFVHGCFWHRHRNCKRASIPTTNIGYWSKKFSRNVERDKTNVRLLKKGGWNVLTVWECQIKNPTKLSSKLVSFLKQRQPL